jgi:metacaspase-1
MKHFLGFGLNAVNPLGYDGWEGILQGCHKDVDTAVGIAQKTDFDRLDWFFDGDATCGGFVRMMQMQAKSLIKGDLLWVHYSGHGASVPNASGDNSEADGNNEAWALYDGLFYDDELAKVLGLFAEGVQVVFTSDSCHSGTMMRNRTEEKALSRTLKFVPHHIAVKAQVFRTNNIGTILKGIVAQPIIRCNSLLVSGCKDEEVSYDTPDGGAFSVALGKEWYRASKKDSYVKLAARLVKALKGQQTPQLSWEGQAEQVNVKPFNLPLK